jgi:hypothetical protein
MRHLCVFLGHEQHFRVNLGRRDLEDAGEPLQGRRASATPCSHRQMVTMAT